MLHQQLVYIYLLNVPSFSSRYFNKIKRTSRLGRLLALSLEILYAAVLYMHATLYAILNKSENATLQYSIFCEKVFDEKYLLKLNNVFQTSSKRFFEISPICIFWCRELCSLFLSFMHWIMQFRMCKKDCYAYQTVSYLCWNRTQENWLITRNKRRSQFRIYQICKKCKLAPFDVNK